MCDVQIEATIMQHQTSAFGSHNRSFQLLEAFAGVFDLVDLTDLASDIPVFAPVPLVGWFALS